MYYYTLMSNVACTQQSNIDRYFNNIPKSFIINIIIVKYIETHRKYNFS